MLSSQLTSEDIIGCQLLKEYGTNINFERGSISYVREGCFREQIFDQQRAGGKKRRPKFGRESNP
jgi:hypothetical protein